MIDQLKAVYRTHLQRYWWGRWARNRFVHSYLAAIRLKFYALNLCARAGFRFGIPVTRFRLRPISRAPAEGRISMRIIHPGQPVAVPGPKAWSDGRGAFPIEQGLTYEYESREVVAYVLRNATIEGRSDLVFQGRNALHHSLLSPSRHAISEELHSRGIVGRRGTRYYRTEHQAPDLELDVAFHLTGSCAFNYAHWLTEMLPRLLIADAIPECRAMPLVIDAGLHPNILESLQRLAPSYETLFELKTDQLARTKRLYYVESPSFVPFDLRRPRFRPRPEVTRRQDAVRFSPYALGLLRERAHALLPSTSAPARRLLLRRRSGVRTLRNYDDIEKTLVREGLEVIEPERLTFMQQVELFRSAELVVAQTGAALANLIFCRPGCRALVLIGESPYAYYQYYSNLGYLLGVHVCNVTGPVVDRSAWHPTHADFVVDPNRVVNAVRGFRPPVRAQPPAL